MAFNFTPERQALNFAPRSHARWSSRQFVLWPAWAYRVVAPRVRQQKLNVLQRATMGLCRAGLYRVASIAEHLSVHADLAAFLVSELRDLGYLDQHGGLTELGESVLEDDASETHEMVAGYVFQDPWSGELWPRFVESLDYCEREFNESGFPTVLLGTTGKPRRVRPFTVLPRTSVSPTTPDPAAVVQAVAGHRKGLRFQDANDHDDEELGAFVASGVQISRVSLVEEEPQAVFLLTYLYVPESDSGAMDWFACDPFGLGQSGALRRRVERVMHEDPGIFGVVNKLVGETLNAGYEDQQRWLEGIHIQAGLEIDRRLTVNFRTHAAFEQVLDLEAARQEMQLLGRDCPDRKIAEVLRGGSKVLEAIFAAIAAAHPLGDIWKRVHVSRRDRRTNQERLVPQHDRRVCMATYEGAFHALGFKAPFPSALLNVKPGQVRAVAAYGDSWRLRPLVTATAMLAQQDPTHPLARAAIRSRGLLNAIDEIASVGGKGGHAGGDAVSPAQAEEHTDKVYDVVSILLGLGAANLDSLNKNTGGHHG
jgi:hypothetical protein